MNGRLSVAVIVVCFVPAMSQEPSVESFESLVTEYRAQLRRYRVVCSSLERTPQYRQFRESGDRAAMLAMKKALVAPDRVGFTRRFLTAAAAHEADERAVPYLTWVFAHGAPDDTRGEAARVVRLRHTGSTVLADFLDLVPGRVRHLGGRTKARAFLSRVIESNPDELVKAHALVARAHLIDRKTPSAILRARRQSDLDEAVALAPGSPVAERAKAPEFEASRLQVGMMAPDIEGTDLDGRRFKLSDYRGKVIVLTFWGDW